ncbi:MAG: apurinic endonuclease, partial [Hyperionvirus sp.]
MYTGLLYVHDQTLKYNSVKILLETPTGQGSEICYKIEDMAY